MKEKINRQNIVSVRFTDTEIAKLQDLAQKRGISEGLLLRELVKNAQIEPREITTWSVASHVQTQTKTRRIPNSSLINEPR